MNSKHTIPIYSTAFLKSPVLAGFLHPRIYLPIHLISDFNAGTISATDIRYMLLHELQHYKHKDILIGYLINTVNVFYWFNPLIWYFLKRIRQERELACDSAVLQLLKETEYKSYGNTLINFAETIALSPFPLTMGISGNIKQLKGRILNIASFHQPTFKQKKFVDILYAYSSLLSSLDAFPYFLLMLLIRLGIILTQPKRILLS